MSLELWQYLLLAIAGFAAGWINVLAGGGSLLTVPPMLFFGLPGPVANGTNRIAVIAQNFTAVLGFRQKGFSDFKLSMSLAGAASIGAFIGALVGVQLDGVWFDRLIAAVIVAVIILMATGVDDAVQSGPANLATSKPRNLVLGHILIIGAGFWGGFIQIAVGFIMIPILYRVMGLDLVRVNMHKVFIALVFSLVSLAVFAAKLDIDWLAGLALAIGNAAGGYLGARNAVEKGSDFIKRVLYVVLVAMVIKLLFF